MRSSISAARSPRSTPGGSLDELLTVYTIVNALTVNLPAITRVQISSTARKSTRSPATSTCGIRWQKNLKWVSSLTRT